jgi:hypothetical protein
MLLSILSPFNDETLPSSPPPPTSDEDEKSK